MGDHEMCNTSLSLGIGLGCYAAKKEDKNDKCITRLDLSLPIHLEDEPIDCDNKTEGSVSMIICEDDKQGTDINKDDDNNMDNNCVRKKLRLTKDQSTLLEESFKKHTTLNTAQKHSLANKLHLKPRQVEVWFQNRRARTKLKQTEADCEFLKKCCESLSKENRRLKKELQELRAMKLPTLGFCSACSSCSTNNVCKIQERRKS